jgi:hypothetical protein
MAVGYDLAPGYTMLAEVWDGAKWEIKSSPLPTGGSGGILFAVSCASSTTCEAVGSYSKGHNQLGLDEAWDGTSFVPMAIAGLGGAVVTDLESVSCTSNTDCQAVGLYRKGGGGDSIPLAESFNGTEWFVTPLQTVPDEEDTAMLGDSCYATTGCIGVGYYSDSGGVQNLLAEQFS